MYTYVHNNDRKIYLVNVSDTSGGGDASVVLLMEVISYVTSALRFLRKIISFKKLLSSSGAERVVLTTSLHVYSVYLKCNSCNDAIQM